MEGWREITRSPIIRPPIDVNSPIAAVTCTTFDKQCDLIWIGDSLGYITSFTAESVVTQYTRFKAHKGPVLKIISHEKGVVSIDSHAIRLTSRRGIVILEILQLDYETFNKITQAALISQDELFASTDTSLITVDLKKGTITKFVEYDSEVVLMASNNRYVALGLSNGSIDVFDINKQEVVKTFNSTSAKLSELDLKEHTLVTCGYSERHGTYVLDPLVNVYDLRTLNSISPIAFPAGASFVRLHPKLPSVAIIASKGGQLQVVDMFDPSKVSLYQADVGPILISLELSFTGDYLALVDGYSLLHIWCHNPELSSMSIKTVALEYPDIPERDEVPIDIDQDIPLSTIGMPYYKEILLSAWPSEMIFKTRGTLPRSVDPSIYQGARIINGITYASYDKDRQGKRNQFNKYSSIVNMSKTEKGKFLSSRNSNTPSSRTKAIDDANIFDFKESGDLHKIPPAFKKLEILYSKFGVDDFDFARYNKTPYSGLETHVDNSYTNSLLQLYRFIPEFFNFVISSLSIENLNPYSLLTELGYLYDMLVKANGQHFRPTNFQHTLFSIPEAANLGLIERDDMTESNRLSPRFVDTERINAFNKFLLERIASDEITAKSSTVGAGLEFSSIFGIKVTTQMRNNYGTVISQTSSIRHSLDIFPPRRSNDKSIRLVTHNSVLSYIESSMYRVEPSNVSNQATKEYDNIEITQAIQNFPQVLSLNLHLTQEERKAIRNTKNWLKPKFYASFLNGKPYINEFSRNLNIRNLSFQEFELSGVVAEISGESDRANHLVTFSKIFDEKTGNYEWYLFNDFLVTKIPEDEVLNLSYWWKSPVNLVYRTTRQDPQFQYDGWKKNLNDSILYRDHFAKGTRENKKIEYELLTRKEAPEPGTLIAIDAEFVTLREEQFEIKSDGTRVLLKPSIQTLARVSVLRGEKGKMDAIPFIDDYVVVKEGIHDYLTSYSGIEHGDLDPDTSNKSLVTRETVYRKLWLLLNLGCIFVGHGLTKDFRMINICVPKNQVRDTAYFFYKGQRILSLRFLAYMLLDERIQTGNHDSIEDARTALLLYRKYLELKSKDEFEMTLNNIYTEGQLLRFKPPDEN